MSEQTEVCRLEFIYIKKKIKTLIFFKKNFAVEVATSEVTDLAEAHIKELIVKAGGANYGTGTAKC